MNHAEVVLLVAAKLYAIRYENHLSLQDADAGIRGHFEAEASMLVETVMRNLCTDVPNGPSETPAHQPIVAHGANAAERISAKFDEVRAARTQQYNDGQSGKSAGFEQIGRIWSAILAAHSQLMLGERDIPPHVVALMMAALKIWRSVRTASSPDAFDDSIVDLMNYGLIAAEVMEDDAKLRTG